MLRLHSRSGWAFAPVSEGEVAQLGEGEDLIADEVNRHSEAIHAKLASQPVLTEGLAPHAATAMARPRSAAFRLAVRRLYDNSCAVCRRGSAGLAFDPPGRADTGRGRTAGR